MFLPLISHSHKIQTYKLSLTYLISSYTQGQDKYSQVSGAVKSENLESGGGEIMGKGRH